MENLQTIERAAVALVTLAAVAGCTTTSPVQPDQVSPPQPAVGVAQAGSGPSSRYVFCWLDSCPAPTVKTRLALAAPAAPAASLLAGASARRPEATNIDIAFPFNSSRMSDSDRSALVKAAATRPGAQVDITARSDFVGPPAGQQKVIAARAKAMRTIVADQAQGAHVIEHREVADPKPVDKARQARQRRGTVRFTPSIDVPPKGNSK